MHQHALDTILERYCAGITCPASPAQLQFDKAVIKPPEFNVTAILLDGRSDPCLQQLLDHANNLAVILVVSQAVFFDILVSVLAFRNIDNGLTRGDCLGNEGKYLGPDMRPIRIPCLGDCDEVCAVEHGRDAVNVHELGGKR